MVIFRISKAFRYPLLSLQLALHTIHLLHCSRRRILGKFQSLFVHRFADLDQSHCDHYHFVFL